MYLRLRQSLLVFALLVIFELCYLVYLKSDDIPLYYSHTQELVTLNDSPQACPLGEFPDHYSKAPVDYHENYECRAYYGPEKLTYTASHYAQYCDLDISRSSLHCFVTQFNDATCVAHGVQLHQSVNVDKDVFRSNVNFHCQVRDLTSDLSNASGLVDDELSDIPDIHSFRGSHFGSGIQQQIGLWNVSLDHDSSSFPLNCSATENNSKTYLLVLREKTGNLYHQLAELSQNLLTLDVLQMAVDKASCSPFLDAKNRSEVEVVLWDKIDYATNELWEILTGKPAKWIGDLEDSCMGSVIMPFAGSMSTIWGRAQWSNLDCRDPFLIEPFIKKVFQHFEINPKGRKTENDQLVISIVKRTNNRKLYNLEKYVAIIQDRYPDADVQLIDWAQMSLRDQILQAQKTHVLIGVLGQGLTQTIFLPPEASVGEIMSLPGDKNRYTGFRNLAKLFPLHYASIDPESEEEGNAMRVRDEEKRIAIHTKPTSTLASRTYTASGPTGTPAARRPKHREHVDWQNVEWVYLKEERFVALVDAAVAAQLHAGTTHGMILAPYHATVM